MHAKDKVRVYIHPNTHTQAKAAAVTRNQPLHEFLDRAIPLGIGLIAALEANTTDEFVTELTRQGRAA